MNVNTISLPWWARPIKERPGIKHKHLYATLCSIFGHSAKTLVEMGIARLVQQHWPEIFQKNSLKKILNVFLNTFSVAPHFYPIFFGRCCPHFTCIDGPKGRNYMLQNRTSYTSETYSFIFLGDGPIKLANCKKKKKTWEASHLVNRRVNNING
jgi:hypothetical protein